MISLSELERLAERATPGPWHDEECNAKLPDGSPCWCRWISVPDDPEGKERWVSPTGNLKADDARFIAAANPETVKALCACIRDMMEHTKHDYSDPMIDELAAHGIELGPESNTTTEAP